MNRQLLPLALTFLITATASAEDFVAQARVLKVVPMAEEIGQTLDTCPTIKPHAGDLVATLRWDLCATPEPRHHPSSRFRVYYEWDGQVHERIVRQHPGDTVPIRVTID